MGGPCDPGFYCPKNRPVRFSVTQEPTAKLQHCLHPQETALLTLIFFCVYIIIFIIFSPYVNLPGNYCTLEASSSMPTDNTTGNICPMGHSCPEGSSTPTICETGYFLSVTGSDDNSDCLICTGGKYCPGTGNHEPAGSCDSGYYCPIGQNDFAPADYNCPVGHYCPGDTDDPIQCENGYYQMLTTQTTCDICDAGYYCDNTANIAFVNATSTCLEGYYCPAGTRIHNEFPCPKGTFNNLTGLAQESDCTLYLGGYACPVTGMTDVGHKQVCSWILLSTGGHNTTTPDQGYYCSNASDTATPALGVMGGPCDPGFYCPKNRPLRFSVTQEPTAKLQHCLHPQETALLTLIFFCVYIIIFIIFSPYVNLPGNYCTLEASSSMPTDNTTGNICPMGHSCPEGSSTPTICETGYFLSVTGSDDNSDCLICTGGKYCPGTGNHEPAGSCDSGYYCPIGQNDFAPADYNCPVGHYCPGDTDDPIQCENGYYQMLTTQTTCDICDAGYYCDNTANIAFVNATSTCLEGITVRPEQGSTMNSHVLKEHSTISQVGRELCLGKK
ncbi:hypothetical protein MAR_011899 [Mya arenaria]|uniref:Uncharacterized protein n=1 Tax=Mya arenaria TaxID=6604 RepID=A0ABY7FVH4_MYAAR|nr:hypothetical protein MAR_011899 [Mya arenaria]